METKSKPTKLVPAPRKMNGGEPKKEVPGTSLEAYHLGYLASSKGVIKVYNPYPNESELYHYLGDGSGGNRSQCGADDGVFCVACAHCPSADGVCQ